MEVMAAAPHPRRRSAVEPHCEQVIRFLPHRGARIAYAVTGEGPSLLLDVGCLHHLEAFWRHAPYRHLVRRLSRRFTVVRWDRPGFGMSDRWAADLSPAAEEALVLRMADLAGGGAVAILAAGDAGPTMVRFAARHPPRVGRLALFGTAARHPLVAGPRGAALATLAAVPVPAIHDAVAAALSAGSDPDVEVWLAAALAGSADVPALIDLLTAPAREPVERDAEHVLAPALVLHRMGDPVAPAVRARALAARIPGARFVPLEGSSHLLYAGDPEPVLAALFPFLLEGEEEPRPLSERELEVAWMVARGLTNAEIGHRLAIRRRTVDAHLEHIRAKLGVSSRASVAAWVVGGRPPGAARRGA